MASYMLSERAHSNLQKILDAHASEKVYDSDGNLTEAVIDGSFRSRYKTVRRHFQDYAIFTRLLPSMTLVSLVSVYDAFLRRMLRNLFLIKPDILNGCSRQITFAELTSFGSVDAARDYIIELEIDSLLRDSHSAQIAWLESRLKIKLTDLPSWKYFIEITERRNLLVHAEGKVSKQYLDACQKVGYEIDEKCALGTILDVDPEYYAKACDYIAEIAIKLNQVIWRKLLPKQLEEAEDSFVDTTFSLLTAGEYHLTELLLTFAQSAAFKKYNAESSLYLNINLAISLKGQNKDDECKKLIRSIDCSALADKFKLASAVLLEDFEAAAALMKKIGPNDDLGKEQYKNWPLFHWFRKTDLFKETYEAVYDEPFTANERISPEDILSEDFPPDTLAADETSAEKPGQRKSTDVETEPVLSWETANEED